MNDYQIIDRIRYLVEGDLPKLSPSLRAWAEGHLVEPREVVFSRDELGHGTITLWLVTDDIGFQDASSRVVFDSEKERFGLAMEMANDVHWFMGLYGNFADTVEAI
jgi:hypothetical protein